MKKFLIADAILFILVSIYSTYSAARVDAGTWTNADPINEVGHYMTMKEAVVYNIPLGIFEGLAVAGITLLAYFVGRAVYKEIKR